MFSIALVAFVVLKTVNRELIHRMHWRIISYYYKKHHACQYQQDSESNLNAIKLELLYYAFKPLKSSICKASEI